MTTLRMFLASSAGDRCYPRTRTSPSRMAGGKCKLDALPTAKRGRVAFLAAGRSSGLGPPGPHAAGVHMDEVLDGVVAYTPHAQVHRSVTQADGVQAGYAHVNGAAFHVEAVLGHFTAAGGLEHRVGDGRAVSGK